MKSTLASIPMYLYLFCIPTLVARTLEKILRNFLWGDEEADKFHLEGGVQLGLSRWTWNQEYY